jgi:hypothetical protein
MIIVNYEGEHGWQVETFPDATRWEVNAFADLVLYNDTDANAVAQYRSHVWYSVRKTNQ